MEVIVIGLTNEARKFLKKLSKIEGRKHEMHGRNLELEAGTGTVDGRKLIVREQVQVNHNVGDRVFVFHNLNIRNGNREFDAFGWYENPELDKLSDATSGQYNLERV